MCGAFKTLISAIGLLKIVIALCVLLATAQTAASQDVQRQEFFTAGDVVSGVEDTAEQRDNVIIYNATKDAFVRENIPDGNYGTLTHLSVSPDCSGSDSEKRTFVCFSGPVAGSGVIVSATLNMQYFAYDGEDPAGRILTARRITEDWDSASITWNNQPAANSFWETESPVDSDFGLMTWDVTASVLYYLDNNDDYYGWRITDPGVCSQPIPETIFHSRQASQPVVRPYLTVSCKSSSDNTPLVYGYVTNHYDVPCSGVSVELKYYCDICDSDSLYTVTDSLGYYEFLRNDFICEEWYNVIDYTVKLGGGFIASQSAAYVPYQLDFGPSCPYVSVWDGDEFVRDNNILPQSEQLGLAVDVDDSYLLRIKPNETSGEYRLRIEEFENEQTSADRFCLAVVDHRPHVNIAVSDLGDVYTWQSPRPARVVQDMSRRDCTSLVAESDGSCARVEAGEVLSLNFGKITGHSSARLIMRPDPWPTEADISQWADPSDRKAKFKVYAGGQNLPEVTAEIQPRENGELAVTDVSDLIPESGEDFCIDVSFPAAHAIDFIALDLSEQVPVEMQELPLIAARHSSLGDVSSRLSSVDGEYAELIPGEHIDLSFEATDIEGGLVRDFILISTGHYKTIGKDPMSGRGLLANYPNPFNPSTEIMFSLDRPSHITMEIYNILGQKVAKIVDEFRPAGKHSVIWNGTSDTGVSVASGVYFCRMKSDDLDESMKMLLMK